MKLRTRTAALALTLPLGLGMLAACGDDDPEPTANDPSDAPSEGPSEPSEPPSTGASEPPPSEPTSEPGADGEAIPVYFTGQSPMGPRLYREFHQARTDEPLEEAAKLLVSGEALDPDYGTLLDGVTIDDVEEEDGAIVVTLAQDSLVEGGKALSAKDAKVAVQSLVYTLQGVTQTREPVRVELADETPTDLFGQPTSDGVQAAKELDVLSLVNITTPEEGAVANGTMSVEGVASSFEATVPFRVEDASGKEVLTDFTTADGWLDKLYPFTAEVDVSKLPPGEYTLVAMTDDPSGGTEGPGPFEDTKAFTIE